VYIYIYRVSQEERTVMVKIIISRFWRIYTFSAPWNARKWFLECRLYVRMYAQMCASLVPIIHIRYLSARDRCQVNTEIKLPLCLIH
jgi:hypothetical protein